MRPSYQTDELAFHDPEFSPKPGFFRRIFSALVMLLTLVAVGATLLYLGAGLAPGEKKFTLHQLNRRGALRDPRTALSSGENLLLDAAKSAVYATHWAALAWRNLSDFEESVELLKTPSDPHNTDVVAQRRKQGAEQLVILLDRHALLPLLVEGGNHTEAAQRIGLILNIRPDAVDTRFRQSQREQLDALKTALDRHLNEEPGKSDLSVFNEHAPDDAKPFTEAQN